MIVICSEFNFESNPKFQKLLSILNHQVYEKNGFKLYSLCIDSSILSSKVYINTMKILDMSLRDLLLLYTYINLPNSMVANPKYEDELEHKKTDCAFELIFITFDSEIYNVNTIVSFFKSYRLNLNIDESIGLGGGFLIRDFILDYKKERLNGNGNK